MRWLASADYPPSAHASLRLARIVLSDESEIEAIVSQAETLLRESDAPAAVAVALASAAFERHLRSLTRQNNIEMRKPARECQIGTYVAALSGEKVITTKYNQMAMSIAGHRDDAAHGWFEDVSVGDAEFVIRAIRKFVVRYPATSD